MLSKNAATAYRWSDMQADQPMPLVSRRRIVGEHAMLSHVSLAKGCRVPTHAHENEQFGHILSGRIRFGIGAEGSPDRHDLILETGQVLYLPPNVPHSAEALEDTVVLDVFSPPSEKTGVDRE